MIYSAILFAGLLFAVKGQLEATPCTTDADCADLTTLYGGLLGGATFVCNPNPDASICTIACATDTDCAAVATYMGVTLTCTDYSGTSVCDTDTSCTTANDCATNGLDAFGLTYCDGTNCVLPPTPQPTTPAPVTPTAPTASTTTLQPTLSPTYDCTVCETDYPADPYRCSTENDDLVYSLFPLDCEEAYNECAAKCAFQETYAAQRATMGASSQAALDAYVAGQGGVDGLFTSFCEQGTCTSTTPAPTTEGLTTTEEESCSCDDQTVTGCWDAEGCSDDGGSGCSIVLNATLDFCLIDGRWSMYNVWSNMKYTYVATLAALVPSMADFCDAADLQIEAWDIDYKTIDARNRARTGPATPAECNDINLDQICGQSRDSPLFGISMSVGFFCGSCADTQTVLLTLLSVLNEDKSCNAGSSSSCDDAFGGNVVSNCMTQSSANDPVCSGTDVAGFGGVAFEVQEAVIAYRDAAGNIIGDPTNLTSGSRQVVCVFAFVVALVMVLISAIN